MAWDDTEVEFESKRKELKQLEKDALNKFTSTYRKKWDHFSNQFTRKNSVWEFAHNYLSLDMNLTSYYAKNKSKTLQDCINSLIEPANLKAIVIILGINDSALNQAIDKFDRLHEEIRRKEYNEAFARYRMKR